MGGELKVQGEDRRGISVSGTVGLLELFVLEGLIQSGSHLCCVMSLTDHTPDWNVTKITSIPLIINTHLIFLLLELQSTTHSAQKYEQYRYICVCVCLLFVCVCRVYFPMALIPFHSLTPRIQSCISIKRLSPSLWTTVRGTV